MAEQKANGTAPQEKGFTASVLSTPEVAREYLGNLVSYAKTTLDSVQTTARDTVVSSTNATIDRIASIPVPMLQYAAAQRDVEGAPSVQDQLNPLNYQVKAGSVGEVAGIAMDTAISMKDTAVGLGQEAYKQVHDRVAGVEQSAEAIANQAWSRVLQYKESSPVVAVVIDQTTATYKHTQEVLVAANAQLRDRVSQAQATVTEAKDAAVSNVQQTAGAAYKYGEETASAAYNRVNVYVSPLVDTGKAYIDPLVETAKAGVSSATEYAATLREQESISKVVIHIRDDAHKKTLEFVEKFVQISEQNPRLKTVTEWVKNSPLGNVVFVFVNKPQQQVKEE